MTDQFIPYIKLR